MNKSESIFYLAESKRFKAKVGVFLVLIHEDRLLCLRRYNTGVHDGLYVVPMGGLDEGERPLQAVVREAAEEVNIIVNEQDLTLAHVMHRKHIQPDGYIFYQQDLYFLTHHYSGTILNLEPHKADDVRFFHLSDLPSNFAPPVNQAIHNIILKVPYSEFGFSPVESLVI